MFCPRVFFWESSQHSLVAYDGIRRTAAKQEAHQKRIRSIASFAPGMRARTAGPTIIVSILEFNFGNPQVSSRRAA